MPRLHALLVRRGASFSAFSAAVPVCCPSRSALYSGRYQHNNGVTGNSLAANCSSRAWQAAFEADSVAVHAAGAGYVTAFAGKYLNMYGDPAAGGPAHVPAGWDDWHGLVGNSRYYDYVLSNNGLPEAHGHDYASDYLTDLVFNRTAAFIGAWAAAGPPGARPPFFAVASPPACHDPTDPAPQYAAAFPGAAAPRTPAYNATAGGSHWMQRLRDFDYLDANAAAYADLKFRRRRQTLQSVDAGVAQLFAALDAAGAADDTYVLYTTDNGYHLGSFGFVYDKRQPWATDVHLPLYVSGPGVPPGTTIDAPAGMVDVSATLLDAMGAPPAAGFDGASLLPLIMTGGGGGAGGGGGGPGGPAPPPRVASLVEYVGESADGGPPALCPRTAGKPSRMYCFAGDNFTTPPLWGGAGVCACQDVASNAYACLRVQDGGGGGGAGVNVRYCEFPRDGDPSGATAPLAELYDYAADPHELVNRAPGTPPAALARMAARLAAARACAGASECAAALAAWP